MKYLVCFFLRHPFSSVHLKKDVGLFPAHLGESFDKVEFLKVGEKKEPPFFFNKMCVKNLFKSKALYATNWKIHKRYEVFCIFSSIIYLFRHREITHIMLFHVNRYSVYFSLLIKWFFPEKKIYIKIDGSRATVDDLLSRNGLSKKRKFFLSILRKVDLISIETKQLFSKLASSPYFQEKLVHVPNGVEKNSKRSVEKEKIVLSVARFGSYPKNTEFLLRCLEQVDWQDWIVYLVGSVEALFQKNIEQFYERRPELRKNIIFLGEINDAEELNVLYKRASVFILPSRFEGFSIASLEAAVNGDYLILSDVGAAQDLILNERYGHILQDSAQGSQNEDRMAQDCIATLKNIISGKIDTNDCLEERITYYTENFTMENIVKKVCFKQWIGLDD